MKIHGSTPFHTAAQDENPMEKLVLLFSAELKFTRFSSSINFLYPRFSPFLHRSSRQQNIKEATNYFCDFLRARFPTFSIINFALQGKISRQCCDLSSSLSRKREIKLIFGRIEFKNCRNQRVYLTLTTFDAMAYGWF